MQICQNVLVELLVLVGRLNAAVRRVAFELAAALDVLYAVYVLVACCLMSSVRK